MDFNLGDVLRVVRGSRRSVIGSDESFGLALVSVSVRHLTCPQHWDRSCLQDGVVQVRVGPISSFFDFGILSPPPVDMGLELLICYLTEVFFFERLPAFV